MCGITGRVVANPTKQKASMVPLELLHHRGPDDSRVYSDQYAFLGHTRLSIIDVENGSQPMRFDYRNKRYVLIYNGEVYNYRELKRELQNEGVVFTTNSDSEVVLKWLVVKGVRQGIRQLNGIFAFCLYNETDHEASIGRDRLGIKPLYYHVNGEGLLFASELNSLVNYEGVHKEIDRNALEQYFYFKYPLAPLTLYKGVYELPAAHLLSYSCATADYRPFRYWSTEKYKRDYSGSFEDATSDVSSASS